MGQCYRGFREVRVRGHDGCWESMTLPAFEKRYPSVHICLLAKLLCLQSGPTCARLPLVQVHWMASVPVSRLANFYGTAITQSGQCESQYDCANIEDSGYTYNDAGKHPMWAAGLNVRAAARLPGRVHVSLKKARPMTE